MLCDNLGLALSPWGLATGCSWLLTALIYKMVKAGQSWEHQDIRHT